MKITVKLRPVYGAYLLDPTNEAARHLAAIAGTKTLTASVLGHAKAMGATIEVAPDPYASAAESLIDLRMRSFRRPEENRRPREEALMDVTGLCPAKP